MSVRWCPECRQRPIAAVSDGDVCERCLKFRQVGVLVTAIARACTHNNTDWLEYLDWLDAVATLCLIAPAVGRRRHNRELREESIEAQRGARGAYHDGYAEGRRDHGDW